MKSKYRLLFIFGVLFAILSFQRAVNAAPNNGEVFLFKQPDNSYVEVKVFGDEFYQRVESIDGYTLIRDPDTNWICFADFNKEENDFISTGVKYTKNPNDKQQLETKKKLKKGKKLDRNILEKKAAKSKKILLSQTSSQSNTTDKIYDTGFSNVEMASESKKILGLTLLVKFPDQDTNITVQDVDDMVNKVGYSDYGNNGSVRDYFYDVSGGAIIYNNYVTNFYVAKNPKSYYEDPNIEVGIRAAELIHEALEDLEQKGFDFSTLTTNSSNKVLALNVLYAGSPDSGWGKGLWPHYGHFDKIFYADDAKITEYQLSSLEDKLSIATFVHENGHMLFDWPDLYDYDVDSKGVGYYSIMSYTGGGNPVPPDPFLRSIWCDWGKVTKLNDLPNQTKVIANAGSLEVFKYEGPNPSEYFLIENVSKKGRWSDMPDQGLIIWHIDEKGSNNWQDMTYTKHYMVSVEQADGKFDLEKNINYGDEDDLFGKPYYTSFTDWTTPNSKWWNGQSSGLNITDISEVGDVMSFVLNNSNESIKTPMPSIALTPTPTPKVTPERTNTPTPKLQKVLIGDVNGDNQINSLDLACLRLYLLGIKKDMKSVMRESDLNGDNSVDSIDFAYLRKYLIGQIYTLN